MSEYQYYEWLKIDRPLTAAEQTAVNRLSSHITVSSFNAFVEYHWSDFKHDPIQVLTNYFDAFIYYSNWGNKRLAFSFPRSLLDPAALGPYLYANIELKTTHDHLILDLAFQPEESEEFDVQVQLAQLAPLRQDILNGDYRALYLAWLKLAEENAEPDDFEPPVPPGLRQLSGPLAVWAEFIEVDPFLLQAAAKASPAYYTPDSSDLESVIPQLTRAECDAFLRRLLHNESLLAVALQQRLQDIARGGAPADVSKPDDPTRRRTWEALYDEANQLQAAQTRRQMAEAEARRLQRLHNLAPRAEAVWNEVIQLIEARKAAAYDQALAHLVELRELAAYQGQTEAFNTRVAGLRQRYSRLSALQTRLTQARF